MQHEHHHPACEGTGGCATDTQCGDTKPAAPPLTALRTILEGMQALRDMDPDEEHPDPTGDALDMIEAAIAELRRLEDATCLKHEEPTA